MFNGSWREAEASSISLDIPDDNIDVEGDIYYYSSVNCTFF